MSTEVNQFDYDKFDTYFRECNMNYVIPDVDFLRTLWTLDTIGFDAAPHKGRFGPCLGAFLADTRRVILPPALAAELLMHPEFRDGRLRPFLQAIEDQGRLGIDLAAADEFCYQAKNCERPAWDKPDWYNLYRTPNVAELYAALDPDHSPLATRANWGDFNWENAYREAPLRASDYEIFAHEFGDADIRSKMADLSTSKFASMSEFEKICNAWRDGLSDEEWITFNKYNSMDELYSLHEYIVQPTPSGYRTSHSKWGYQAELSIVNSLFLSICHRRNLLPPMSKVFVDPGFWPEKSDDQAFVVAEDIEDAKKRERLKIWIGSMCLLSERLRMGRLGTPLFRAAFRVPWYHRAGVRLPISTATSFDYLIEAVLAGRLAPENLIQAARCQVRVAGPERLLIQPDSLRPALPDDLDPISRLAIEAVWEDGIVPPADNGIALATRLPLRTARYHWTALDHRLNARPAPTVAQAKLIVETTLKQSRRDSLARGARRDGIVDFPRFVAFLRNQHLNPEPGRPANMIVPPETLEHVEKIAEREMFHLHYLVYGVLGRLKPYDYNLNELINPIFDYMTFDADDILRQYATRGYDQVDLFAEIISPNNNIDVVNHPQYSTRFLDPWVYPIKRDGRLQYDEHMEEYYQEFPLKEGTYGVFTEEYFRELWENYQYVIKSGDRSEENFPARDYIRGGELIEIEERELNGYHDILPGDFKKDYYYGILDK